MKPPVYNPDWSAEVQALYRHDLQEIWDQRIAPHVWNQYHNQLAIYLAYADRPAMNVLDVGCAQGTLALLLGERGHRVTAVDLRPEFLEYAKSRHTTGDVRFIQANALAGDIPGQYDLIFANQIIEHLVYPDQLLLRLIDRLKPGGRIVVTTPNGDYAKNTLPSYLELGNPKDWEHLQFTADGDGHFYAYLREELMAVFTRAGLVDVSANFSESPFISGHLKVRHAHAWMPVALLRGLDRAVLAIPWAARRLGHQLLVTGVFEEAMRA